ncbi:MAG: A/G-specific adenine glycosylase [Verrucomicrobia bacterium]|nr:A/G-specific adenine glycosylase [Verrucomicrobiota bacterium]
MNDIRWESTDFRGALGAWFVRHGRVLPWRLTSDPYCILVSELMLQQTQVVTVVPYYERWMNRFPTLVSLAEADESEVLREWQGLGYYNRARNLHQCAKRLVADFNGEFPTDLAVLEQLPGLGRYTAGAIATFAFNLPAPIVDANIARVLARITDLQLPIDSANGKAAIWDAAARIAQCSEPRRVNSALMELGALICLPRKPTCLLCPVQSFCRATDPEALPRKRPRPLRESRSENYHFLRRKERVFLTLSEGPRWRGLWTLPPVSGTPPTTEPALELTHGITRFLITIRVFQADASVASHLGGRWHPEGEVAQLPMPTPHRKALEKLLSTRGVRSEN